MTDRDGGHPAIDWQAKGEVPSLFSMVEEPMAIDENGEDIVIDFDVGRSFLADSSTNGFIFIPFLRAITRAGSGGIEGTLVNAETGDPIPLAAVSVHYDFDTASALGPLVSTTRTDESGAFTASFLRPGRYTVLPEDLVRGTPVLPAMSGWKPARQSTRGTSSSREQRRSLIRLDLHLRHWWRRTVSEMRPFLHRRDFLRLAAAGVIAACHARHAARARPGRAEPSACRSEAPARARPVEQPSASACGRHASHRVWSLSS